MKAGLLVSLIVNFLVVASAGSFYNDFYFNWGHDHGKVYGDGSSLSLSLDKYSGSGFQSKEEYLFGKIDVQLKLVPGNSAGTVTTFYLSSLGPYHDEIDFRIPRKYKWSAIHSSHQRVQPSFSVDGIAIREFKNLESIGIPFPKNQPMRIYSSLWEADDWATCGGKVKTDWTKAPFVASFRNININACTWSYGASSCKSNSGFGDSSNSWIWEQLDSGRKGQVKWVRDNYIVYDYCKDYKRFPYGLPRECDTNFH
ncbi:XYLOGLUCAN ENDOTRANSGLUCOSYLASE/HYDROLASE [Salix viminalis]|uniref:Xyloglucan endotransglucosylase/hydrolase n=1 Tax=Salix viminalis TaxID=40686 RepID=A0A9Q0V696_SALVM|nr:XYLOGLUCAN ENDOTRANSGLUCOSYLASE/HYDROLASE [Salix viminalis]